MEASGAMDLMAAALDLMAGALKIWENPLWRRQNKRKSLMEASGAMDLMATALDLLARALKNKGKQHKWLGHSISGWVIA